MGKIVQDLMLDVVSGDLIIEDGDFVIADSTEQHQQCLLLASKGDYKQNPMLGVDVMNWLNDEAPQDLMREVRIQFSNDGMKINKLPEDLKGDIKIDAFYK